MTIQAQILDLLRTLKDKINASIMLITHDLGVIAEMADYVVVMYAGRIVEKGTASEVFHTPKHPYTIGLMESKPNVTQARGPAFLHSGQRAQPDQHAGLLLFQRSLRALPGGLRRAVSAGNLAFAHA